MERLTSSGCSDSVEIYRDDFGIPHVFASNIYDVFFGQGLVHASDRPNQIIRSREKVYGYNEGLIEELDFPWGRTGLKLKAIEEFENLRSHTKKALSYYAAGLNLGLTRYLLREPRGDSYWNPWDSIAIFKLHHLDMGAFSRKLARTKLMASGHESAVEYLYTVQDSSPILNDYGKYNVQFDPSILSGIVDYLPNIKPCDIGPKANLYEEASNSWAVAGDKSTTGLPIVVGDSHRKMEVPNVYYQVHLVCPNMNAIGFSFPGIPGIPHFGHNDHVAWCITYGCGDSQDLYIERLDGSSGSYYYDGKWHALRTSLFDSDRDYMQQSDKGVQKMIGWTKNGPLIWHDEQRKYGLSLRWTSFVTDSTFDAIVSMLMARNTTEMDNIMRSWVEPVNNLIMADKQGKLNFRLRGKVPIRAAENRWVAVPGWDPHYQWRGFVPFDEMPADASRKVIYTANNPVVGDDYPYYLSVDYRSDLRSRRIDELLSSYPEVGIPECVSILGDIISLAARQWVKSLQQLQSTIEDDQKAFNKKDRGILLDVLSVISDWEGEMSIELSAPTLYTETIWQLVKIKWSDLMNVSGLHDGDNYINQYHANQLNQLRNKVTRLLVNDRLCHFDLKSRESAKAIKILIKAYHTLVEKYGRNSRDWKWGDVHHLAFQSIFEKQAGSNEKKDKTPLPGDDDTIRVGSFNIASLNRDVDESSVTRYIFSLADWNDSKWIVPGGISEDPEDPHFMDQFSRWEQNKMIPAYFSPTHVRNEFKKTIQVNPT